MASQIVNSFAIPNYVHQAPLAGDWEVRKIVILPAALLLTQFAVLWTSTVLLALQEFNRHDNLGEPLVHVFAAS